MLFPRLALAQVTHNKSAISITASDAKIRAFEKRLEVLENRKLELSRKLRKLKAELDDLSKGISKIKLDKNRGFIANARLQRLLAKHLEISKELEKAESELNRNRESRIKLIKQLRQVYDAKITQIVESLNIEKDKAKQVDLVHEYFTLLEKAARFKTSSTSDSALGNFSIELDPLDGPREINEKIDLLNDRIERLELIIKQIDKEIARLKEKRALAIEMQQMMEERNLFEDGVRFLPSPRTLPVRPSGGGDTNGSGSDSGFDEAGVHTSPVSGEGAEGGAYMIKAIDKEIIRLNNEKKELKRIITGLKEKIRLFKEKAREVSG